MKCALTLFIILTTICCSNRHGRHMANEVAADTLEHHIIKLDSLDYVFEAGFTATEITSDEIARCKQFLKDVVADYNQKIRFII